MWGDGEQAIDVAVGDWSTARLTLLVKLGHERIPVPVAAKPVPLRPPLAPICE